MIDTIHVDICGHHYSITTYSAIFGTKVLFRLAKGLKAIKACLPEDASSIDAILGAHIDLSSALDIIIDQITEEGNEEFIFSMFKNVTRDNQDLSNRSCFEMAYAQNYQELFKAVFEIIKINYFEEGEDGGFFSQFITKVRTMLANNKEEKTVEDIENTKSA